MEKSVHHRRLLLSTLPLHSFICLLLRFSASASISVILSRLLAHSLPRRIALSHFLVLSPLRCFPSLCKPPSCLCWISFFTVSLPRLPSAGLSCSLRQCQCSIVPLLIKHSQLFYGALTYFKKCFIFYDSPFRLVCSLHSLYNFIVRLCSSVWPSSGSSKPTANKTMGMKWKQI